MKKDSWLYSDSFLKRAFAVWGHYFVANLIIGIPVAVIAMMIAMMFATSISSVSIGQ